jgi:hypothetical protein
VELQRQLAADIQVVDRLAGLGSPVEVVGRSVEAGMLAAADMPVVGVGILVVVVVEGHRQAVGDTLAEAHKGAKTPVPEEMLQPMVRRQQENCHKYRRILNSQKPAHRSWCRNAVS